MSLGIDSASRRQERKHDNPLENLEKLSRFVYRLNFTDKTSEDYVYFQIILHLAEHGSFTTTELDRKIIMYKKTRDGNDKKKEIERRKLKKILEGTDKNFVGLIPLNYVRKIPEWKNRGGKQEYTYYLTEKGIIASIGFYPYKQNINLKKILKYYQNFGRKYQKFIREFIKLQIQVYLSYYYVQGLSLTFKKEHDVEYDEFRQKIVKPFDLRIKDNEIEKHFDEILDEFNTYRIIHKKLFQEKDSLDLIWGESRYSVSGLEITHGFQGWYQLQCLTGFDSNLKIIKYKPKRRILTNRGRSNARTTVTSVSEPEFIFSRFQEDTVSNTRIKATMKTLGLIR